jgi:hypothetical protein
MWRWILVTPPGGQDPLGKVNAAPEQWAVERAFDTAQECEDAKRKHFQYWLGEQRNIGGVDAINEAAAWNAARCLPAAMVYPPKNPGPEEVKLVLVEWLDSHAGRGWQDIRQIQDAAEPMHCRSVGWLVSETGGCKVIVPHLAGEKNGETLLQGRGDLTIPNRAIVRIRTLARGQATAFSCLDPRNHLAAPLVMSIFCRP